MSVPVYNGWEFYTGTGFVGYVSVLNPDGSAYNLTGFTIAVAIKDAIAGTTEVSSGNITVTITDAVNGKFNWKVNATGTSGVPSNLSSLVYDIVGTPASGDPVAFLKGTITVTKRV